MKLYNKSCFASDLLFMPINTNTDITSLNLLLYRINLDGKIDNVQDIFCVPKSLVNYSEFVTNTCYIENGVPRTRHNAYNNILYIAGKLYK